MKKKWKGEEGYLLVSTLFFLIFSGLFSHSIMQLTSNNLRQLNQFANAYQAKAALEMSAALLKDEMEDDYYPKNGRVETSVGTILIRRKGAEEEYHYTFSLKDKQDTTYTKDMTVKIMKYEEEVEDSQDESEEVENKEEKNEEADIPEDNIIDIE